ncbi:MAG: VWA domain-containing protein [Thermoanaerobaculia bacterium]|nr:VWA domain-containing protein [Thermoanaerobaculia bacterium]
MIHRNKRWCLILTALVLAGTTQVLADVDTFDIEVPRKDAPGQQQITKLRLAVQVDTEDPIRFVVDPPGAGPQTSDLLQPVADPDNNSWTHVFGADFVRILPPDSDLPADDPRRRNYKFVIDPGTDFGGNCQTLMAGDETWTIEVDGGADRIGDVCLISIDQNFAMNQCNGGERPVPLSEPVAELGGIAAAEQTCRFGVEAVLVLDRSGSMGGSARPAEAAGPDNVKIESLSHAVETFLMTLEDVRSTESMTFGTVPTDEVGIVIFNQNAEFLASLGAGLHDVTGIDATVTANQFGVSPDPVSPSGSTSIGDGLLLADAELGGVADRRRIALLMSDGRQNTNEFVGADVTAGRVFTHSSGATDGPDLPNLGNYQIYSVTVGTGTAVSAAINQDVARATGGFYLNSEDDAGDLVPFFAGILQNFLETNTWQTVLAGRDVVSATGPFAATVPVTSTTQAIVIGLAWERRHIPMCLRVRPPGASDFERRCGETGLASFTRAIGRSVDHLAGDWDIEIEVSDPGDQIGGVPFHLLVLTDDVGLDSRIGARGQTFAVGEPVLIEAELTSYGEPLQGLDPARLRVQRSGPATTLGELLSDSRAGTDRPADGDAELDAAGAKLQNTVEGDPSVLDRIVESTQLNDDGTGGDRQAGDGIYSAEISFEEDGHSDFVVTLEGSTTEGGSFRRHKQVTVYARAVPDDTETNFSTTLLEGDLLGVRAVPRTRFGHRMGPGWGNYFWVSGPGVQPTKLRDNLDGSYSANVAFSGGPPALTLHFIPDTVVITDAVLPEDLPSPLDDSTSVGSPSRPPGSAGPWSFGLHLGLAEPVGDAGDVLNGGLAAGLDLEYALPNPWAFGLFLGWDQFDGPGGFEPDVTHLSLYTKRYVPLTSRADWFFGLGIGTYEFSPGPRENGFSLFTGFQLNLPSDWALEGTLKYHSVSDNDFEFLELLGGFRYSF